MPSMTTQSASRIQEFNSVLICEKSRHGLKLPVAITKSRDSWSARLISGEIKEILSRTDWTSEAYNYINDTVMSFTAGNVLAAIVTLVPFERMYLIKGIIPKTKSDPALSTKITIFL